MRFVEALFRLVAVIMAFVVAFTGVVDTVNEPLVWPAGITILAGTEAAGLLLESVTLAPPVGAGAARVTVPVDGVPPVTDGGFTDTPLRVTG